MIQHIERFGPNLEILASRTTICRIADMSILKLPGPSMELRAALP
jgi:hypothetical protein